MTNENDAKAVVRKNRGGTIEECFGPSRIMGCQVWEVWAHDGDEYVTRFVLDGASQGPQYYASFGDLCVYLDKKYDAQHARIAQLSGKRHVVQLYVAAGVFVAAVGVLLYLTVAGRTPDQLTFGVLASLIASGGVMFYGAWRHVSL